MNKESGKVQMAKLARSRFRQAELHAQLAEALAEDARICEELADGAALDMRTMKRNPVRHRPKLIEPSPEYRALGDAALRDASNRRRAAR